ncbi:MAG TPA: prohibitin family protein [Bryobacteraceae bacterium]|nr:prohibitin family protein [Bryobacteraceae bacterium]
MSDWAARQYRRSITFARHHAPYLILLTFLLAFFLVLFFNRIVISIQPGELGVLWRWLGGGTQIDTVYREGAHVILPFNKMYVYNVRKQQFIDTIDVLTVDGLTVVVRYSVRYYLEKDTLPLLHQRVGPDYVNVIVRPEIRSVMRTVFGQYKPEEIYATQKAIQERVSVVSKTHLAARFVALDDVPIESIKLPVRISDAIEAKMAQQQVDQEYVYRLSIASKESDRKRLESAGIKLYNDTINSSLTPSVLAWHGIQATQELAKSPNSKVVVIGEGKNGLPLILGQ